MIPQRRNQEAEERLDEPEATRKLSKKALYNMLAETYYLPNILSRGVTRPYLVGVFRDVYLRVPLLEIKTFLAGLTPSLTKRAPHHNTANAFARLQAFVAELQLHPFGFEPNTVPDDKWLMDVARFIDRKNTC